ncbi:MAG: hypothetical protein QG628_376 [Patescibacteria group bacterium]|nr:hypothetical protein [Patescibacteria group bacterium]
MFNVLMIYNYYMRSNGGRNSQAGFTLVELTVGVIVLGIIASSLLMLYAAMVNSQLLNKRKAVASTLATNQMEYLKSLPYNSLAVAGGSIVTSAPLPATTKTTINGAEYTTTTSINYVDDAFDGCGNYPTQALKELYCRNFPAPSGAPATDTNRGDYKIIHVNVSGPTGVKFAEVDTQVSARVAETASTTGALFVTVIDGSGNPVSGAKVDVSNTALNPDVVVSDTSDSNGTAVFYGLPPDIAGYNYSITASLNGYSTLSTIAPAGALQPNYSSQRIFTQLSSLVTLTIKPQGSDSLLIETTNSSGTPLANAKIYFKGGYKKYVDPANTSYYYDTLSPTDTRPTTNASGLVGVSDLVPGAYIFCGDNGATSCSVGGTTYYLSAAVPYSGANPFNPITVPTFSPASPPSTTFPFNSVNYLQKVRLMLTTNSSAPRIQSISPSDASLSGGTIGALNFQLVGVNLPCSAVAASCQTDVSFTQGASNYPAVCTGDSSGLVVDCTVNLSGAGVGIAQLVVTSN